MYEVNLMKLVGKLIQKQKHQWLNITSFVQNILK